MIFFVQYHVDFFPGSQELIFSMKSMFRLSEFIKRMLYYLAFVDMYWAIKLEIKIELRDYTWRNVNLVQHFFSKVFPIQYQFHSFVEMMHGDLVKLAFHNEEMIGFLYSHTDLLDSNVFVIGSIGCLPKYRHRGVGSYLLEYALQYAENKGSYKFIHLCVQTSNKIALKFYQKYGFKIIKEEPDYYFNTEDADAYKMEKIIQSPMTINSTTSNQTIQQRQIIKNELESRAKFSETNLTMNIRSLLVAKLKKIVHKKFDT